MSGRWRDQTTFVPRAGDDAGNCLQACVASLLGLPLEDVPNFAAVPEGGTDGKSHWFFAFERWLRDRDLGVSVWYPTRGCDWYMAPESLAIASGKSPRGDFQHSVVVRVTDGAEPELVHDPHPSRAGLAGPAKELWLLHRLDPVQVGP